MGAPRIIDRSGEPVHRTCQSVRLLRWPVAPRVLAHVPLMWSCWLDCSSGSRFPQRRACGSSPEEALGAHGDVRPSRPSLDMLEVPPQMGSIPLCSFFATDHTKMASSCGRVTWSKGEFSAPTGRSRD